MVRNFKRITQGDRNYEDRIVMYRLFYSCNRVKLDGKFIGRRIPKKPALPHRSPTKEEVTAIVESANLRGKALVGLLCSTGIRLGAIPPLKIRHRRRVKPEELEHHNCSCIERSCPLRFDGYLLNVYEGETEQYFTVISEEGSKWLDAYHENPCRRDSKAQQSID